jgi:hypothetical protein
LLNKTVIFRVEMDVINVLLIVGIVADQVFPLTAWPNTSLAAGLKCGGACFAPRQQLGKCKLDYLPTCLPAYLPVQSKIGIACGQRAEAMHVLGQHHPRVDMEGVPGLGGPHRGTQQINLAHQ